MKGHAVVTGGAGFVGSHVGAGLLAEGWRVTAVDNFDPFYDRAVKERALAGLGRDAFSFVEGDVRDPATLDRALRGSDVVIHLAARAGVRASFARPDEYHALNVGGTEAVLAACRRQDVRRVVFASSSSVYGATTPGPFHEDAPPAAPLSPYAATKQLGEGWCRAFAAAGLGRVAVARLFTVYGPGQRPDMAVHRFTSLLLRGKALPRFGAADSARDYTEIHDITRGILGAVRWTAAAGSTCEVFNLGGGTPVSLATLIAALGQAVGRVPQVEPQPASPGDVPYTWADLSKSRRVLGYEPSVPLSTGLRRFVGWFARAHGYQSRSAA